MQTTKTVGGSISHSGGVILSAWCSLCHTAWPWRINRQGVVRCGCGKLLASKGDLRDAGLVKNEGN